MLWIIGAVSSILFGILIALLTKRSCSCVPNMALSVILIFVSAFSNIFATTTNQDVKIMDNPKNAGKIETRKVTGTVNPDEWWNSFAIGTREKEIYYIYASNNKINVVNESL